MCIITFIIFSHIMQKVTMFPVGNWLCSVIVCIISDNLNNKLRWPQKELEFMYYKTE